jgi:hypothetical protein
MSNTDSDTKLTVEKFKGENFHLWKFRMMMLMKEKGVWGVIDEEWEAGETEKGGVKRKEDKAMALIVLSLSDAQLLHVQTALTAKEAWLKLIEVHERKGLANKLYLCRKFLTITMEEGDSMIAHINKVKTLAQQLEAIGEKLREEDIVTTLLYSLPETFESLIVALEARADDLTLEFITARLMHEELRRKEGGLPSGGSTKALLAGHTGQSHKKNGNSKQRTCFYCEKPGHFKKDCRKRLADLEKGRQQANVARTPRNARAEHLLFAGQEQDGGMLDNPSTWIVDSGASQHMSHRNDWLDSYEEMKPVDVLLADNSSMKAVGRGQVSLGGGIRLQEVWYIPNLGKNLLSVRKVTERGAKVEFGLRGCQITTPDGQRTIKATQEGGLYVFQASEHADLASGSSESGSFNSLELWHRRLGHLNVQDLKKLENLVTGMKITDRNVDIRHPCEACIVGKSARLPFPKRESSKPSGISSYSAPLEGFNINSVPLTRRNRMGRQRE